MRTCHLAMFQAPRRARKGQSRGWKITLLRRGFNPCEPNEIVEKDSSHEKWFGRVIARFCNKAKDISIFIRHKKNKNLVLEMIVTGVHYFFGINDLSTALSYPVTSKLFYIEKALAIRGKTLEEVPKGFWRETYGDNLFMNPRYQGSRIGFI